jgi:predicted negative regulator of RcsB-dependent stress response
MSQVSQKEQAKALKGPDAFQVRIMNALDWLVKNTRLVLMVLAPLALVAVGIFGWQYVSKLQKNSRLEDLGKVQVVFDEELKKANDARMAISKQVEDLDKKIAAAAPKADPAKPDEAAAAVPEDPKLKAEKEALEKKIEAIKPDHSASVVKFKEFYDSHAKTPEGWMAGMTAARLYADQEKLAEARPILESILEHSKDNPFYQTQARLSLIGILEELSEYDRALAEIEALDKLVDKEMKPRVLLAKGRILMLKNDKEQAKATFSALIDAHGTSPEAQKARSIQALLN